MNQLPKLTTFSAIPESALDEENEDDEDEVVGEMRDDERTGTRYNVSPSIQQRDLRLTKSGQYSWFHVIFSIAAMYVAMLLTDWYVFSSLLRYITTSLLC